MTDPIFIDECLSAVLVAVAKARGLHAVYGPHVGKSGWQDRSLVSLALDEGYVLVTNNRRDFLREYLKHDLHSGLIILVPSCDREMQIELFSRALDGVLRRGDEMTNQLLEVLADGGVHVRAWTSGDHDIGHIQNPRWPQGSAS